MILYMDKFMNISIIKKKIKMIKPFREYIVK